MKNIGKSWGKAKNKVSKLHIKKKSSSGQEKKGEDQKSSAANEEKRRGIYESLVGGG